jgi:membrane protein
VTEAAREGTSRGAGRSALVSFWWTFRDYVKRIWDNSGEDNVLFLAGGIAFNILLAAVPFVLLLASAVTYLLPLFYTGAVNSQAAVLEFLDRLLPAHAETADSPLHKLIADLMRVRGSLGLYSAIGFVWFSTRLFGSLRAVLAEVFDIETERGIVAGKIFDVKMTVLATLLFVGSIAVTTYVSLATSRSVQALAALGLRNEVMGRLEYYVGRTLAFGFIALMFFALYKYLPIRRVRAKSAWVAAIFTSCGFEAARIGFSYYVNAFNPASLYTGTLTAIIVVVFWVYYAALIFILGGEVGQVYDLRRTRKLQREVFID